MNRLLMNAAGQFTAATFAILASSHVLAAPSTPWPELATPPKSKLEWVAQDATVNGLPTRIQHVQSELGVSEFLGFYRALWAGAPNGAPTEKQIGSWNVITTIQGPVNIAVQMKKIGDAGSEGYISMGNFAEAKKDFYPPSWPTLNVKVLQFMESIDGPKRSYQLTAISESDLRLTTSHVKNEFLRKGWTMQAEQKVPGQNGSGGYHVQMLRDGGSKTLDITTSQSAPNEQVALSVNLIQSTGDRR